MPISPKSRVGRLLARDRNRARTDAMLAVAREASALPPGCAIHTAPTASPRPWSISQDTDLAQKGRGIIGTNSTADIHVIGDELTTLEQRRENLRLIVRAVNAHDALVEALADIAKRLPRWRCGEVQAGEQGADRDWDAMARRVNDALKLAKA